MGAPKATAKILKFASVGQFGRTRTFRTWVEVRPKGAPSFHAEMNLAVREKSLSSLEEGALIEVLVQEGHPPFVVYNGRPARQDQLEETEG